MHKNIASLLMLVGFTTQSQAQQNSNDNSLELPNIVVTATRTEVAKDQLATATTVYTRKDIERLQVQTLPDLLKGTSGVDVVQNGGYGKVTSVFMRGNNSASVLVLIDGIKVGSATTGTSPFEFIPMDSVERVEIIKGPQSSLYGSEAMGGVIQIFTRKGSITDKPSITLDSGGGTYNTYKTAGTVSGKWKNNWYTLGSSGLGSHGFNAQQSVLGYYEPDNDGYNSAAVNARVGHHFDNNGEVEAFFLRTQGTTNYDGSYQNKTNFIEQVVGTSASMNFFDNWRSTLRFGQSQDDGEQFAPDGTFSSKFNTTRWNTSWLNQFTITENHQLTSGIDYRLDEVNSSENYKVNSRYDTGVFTELHSKLWTDHLINASLRYDKNQQFGDYVTGSAGWRYNWNYGVSFLSNFGNSFRAPTFNELYWPDSSYDGFVYPGGNPTLKPEESKSVEVGVLGDHEWGNWGVRAYHTNVDNLISNWPPVNVNKAKIEGIETELGTQLMGWNGKLTMNLLNPINVETNTRLIGRAKEMLSFDLSRTFGKFDVGTYVLAQSDRDYIYYDENFDQKTKTIRGFVTVDLRSAYHLNKSWMLSGKLSNLLDENYQTVYTYNMMGRNFFVSIHYNN
jgi:vitamin B12 transporter